MCLSRAAAVQQPCINGKPYRHDFRLWLPYSALRVVSSGFLKPRVAQCRLKPRVAQSVSSGFLKPRVARSSEGGSEMRLTWRGLRIAGHSKRRKMNPETVRVLISLF